MINVYWNKTRDGSTFGFFNWIDAYTVFKYLVSENEVKNLNDELDKLNKRLNKLKKSKIKN